MSSKARELTSFELNPDTVPMKLPSVFSNLKTPALVVPIQTLPLSSC